MFDVMIQAFANGATGLSVFDEPDVDDPGCFLALGRAISLAVPFEDVIMNGTTAPGAVRIHNSSAPALGSAMRHPDGRYFVAVTPSIAWLHTSCSEPAPVPVRFSFSTVGHGGGRVTLKDLVTGEEISCGKSCEVRRSLSASAVFAATPIASRATESTTIKM